MMKKIKELYSKIYSYFENIRFFKIVKRIFTLRGGNMYAPAALSFYLVLSFIPSLLLIEIILSLINISFDKSLSFISFIFGLEAISISIKELISSLNASSFLSLGISFSIIVYLASKGLSFFSYQVKIMYGITYEEQPYFKRRILPLGLTLISLIILSFLVVFLIIFDSFVKKNNVSFYAFFEYIFVLLILFIFITFLYKLTTPNKVKITKFFLGSSFATIGIGVGIFIYSFYLKNISSTLSYFGPLSSVALLFLILLFSSYILFWGVEINILINEKDKKAR